MHKIPGGFNTLQREFRVEVTQSHHETEFEQNYNRKNSGRDKWTIRICVRFPNSYLIVRIKACETLIPQQMVICICIYSSDLVYFGLICNQYLSVSDTVRLTAGDKMHWLCHWPAIGL